MNKLTGLKNKLQTPRAKKIIVRVIGALIVAWVIFRIVMLALMGRQVVFNATRENAVSGLPVNVVVASVSDDVLRIPIAVRSNVAYVSSGTVGALRPGMKVGDGEIVSVSRNLDLDSGMYVVRTRGVADGLHMVEYRAHGIFVPVHAVANGVVMVNDRGVAVARDVVVARNDEERALISSGIVDGDIVIVSHVDAGVKVKTVEKQ